MDFESPLHQNKHLLILNKFWRIFLQLAKCDTQSPSSSRLPHHCQVPWIEYTKSCSHWHVSNEFTLPIFYSPLSFLNLVKWKKIFLILIYFHINWKDNKNMLMHSPHRPTTAKAKAGQTQELETHHGSPTQEASRHYHGLWGLHRKEGRIRRKPACQFSGIPEDAGVPGGTLTIKYPP